MKHPDLLLFAKAPLAGAVKTRLQPQCTPEQAAQIAEFMIRETAAHAVSFWPGDVYLYCAPARTHPLFEELAASLHLRLADQGEGDLGARMARALAAGIARRGAAAVMGCDVPHCSWSVLEQAFETLARGGEVIGPSVDGGYYLLGLQHVEPELFRDFPWGGPRVALLTRARADGAGHNLEELATLRDIDDWEDLVAVAREYAPLRQFVDNS